MKRFQSILFSLITLAATAQVNPKLQAKLDQQANAIEPQVICIFKNSKIDS